MHRHHFIFTTFTLASILVLLSNSSHFLPGFEDGFTSLAHPWASGATAWTTAHLLGIRPLTPGYGRTLIAPHGGGGWVGAGGGLRGLEGTVPTPHGTVGVSLRVSALQALGTVPSVDAGSGDDSEGNSSSSSSVSGVLQRTVFIRVFLPDTPESTGVSPMEALEGSVGELRVSRLLVDRLLELNPLSGADHRDDGIHGEVDQSGEISFHLMQSLLPVDVNACLSYDTLFDFSDGTYPSASTSTLTFTAHDDADDDSYSSSSAYFSWGMGGGGPIDSHTGSRSPTATLSLLPGCSLVQLNYAMVVPAAAPVDPTTIPSSTSTGDSTDADRAPATSSTDAPPLRSDTPPPVSASDTTARVTAPNPFPPPSYPAAVMGRDSATSGNWMGTYGGEGYVLFAYDGPGVHVSSLPAWVTSVEQAFGHAQSGPWPTGGSDPRALVDPRDPSGPRKIGQYSVPPPPVRWRHRESKGKE